VCNSVPGFEEEDGMFEELFPAPTLPEDESEAEDEVAESSGLVPQEWRSVQEELAKTKKQRKRETLDLLERRARERQERERMLLEKQVAGREVYREKFFPRVLPEDMTTEASDDEDGPLVPEETPRESLQCPDCLALIFLKEFDISHCVDDSLCDCFCGF
jgi:hypothetical protein